MSRIRNRPASTGKPTTVDLFCGAGGITQGFLQAGFQCLYGNDIDDWAIRTFAHNHPEAWADDRDVAEVDPAKVRRRLKLKRGELAVLVGGPPCQGFSIYAHGRFIDDARNALFRHYVRFIDEFKPQFFLMENVTGMLSLGDGKVFQQIIAAFKDRKYAVSAKILFAAHYGVPQERWRLIILGAAKPPVPGHPLPTHLASGRANFRGGSTMVFRLTEEDEKELLPAVTVGDAISDLPRLEIGEGSEEVKLNGAAVSGYASSLRNGATHTYNHVAPRISRINIERAKHIKPGGSWRDIPFALLPKGMKRARRSDHTKRYGRLRNDGMAATIMTRCDPHWGPVFLPDQDRTLTVREAARLQSFPDTYRFLGPRVAQYEQVGNAVPVLMAQAIASAIRDRV